MTLKNVLKHIDNMSAVRIWYADNPNKEFKSIDIRFADECPKWLKKYKLIKAKYNEDGEAMCPCHYEPNEHGVIIDYIRITVVKEQ